MLVSPKYTLKNTYSRWYIAAGCVAGCLSLELLTLITLSDQYSIFRRLNVPLVNKVLFLHTVGGRELSDRYDELSKIDTVFHLGFPYFVGAFIVVSASAFVAERAIKSLTQKGGTKEPVVEMEQRNQKFRRVVLVVGLVCAVIIWCFFQYCTSPVLRSQYSTN